MARFQRPSDPRQADIAQTRPRRQRGDAREPIPWFWLVMGVLVTAAGIVLALMLATALLSREPLTTVLPTPTIIRLTAPPSPIPTETTLAPTPTPIPTLTVTPTPNTASAPAEVTVGFYAAVGNTDGIGVSVRSGPSVDNSRLLLAPEGTVVEVMGGPAEGSNFSWWQVRLEDGTEGWIVADFLVPAPAP
jgi:hypothetical protein